MTQTPDPAAAVEPEAEAEAPSVPVSVIESARELAPPARVERLQAELDAVLLERQIELLESFSATFGGAAASVNLSTEFQQYDDGQSWHSGAGVVAGIQPGAVRRRYMPDTEQGLDDARMRGRALAAVNEFAIGAMSSRVAYTVGSGLVWRAVPRSLEQENPEITKRINEYLGEFRVSQRMGEVDRETMWRADRDGEVFLRLFPGPAGLSVRFAEPEWVRQPSGTQHRFGVEYPPNDPANPIAFWIGGERVSAQPINGIPRVMHLKMNAMMNTLRGWPTLWSIEGNLNRAEKLLRNMSIVSSIQAAIAMIRKHSSSTENQVNALLDATRDLKVSNLATGRDTSYRALQPGTVFDAGPGVSYEAPISNVTASQYVEVLRAELRAAAARLVMPEFMFTADLSSAPFASALVAEGPAVKQFEILQHIIGEHSRRVHLAAVKNEIMFGTLPESVLETHTLQAEFPSLVVRDQLQEAQRKQIMLSSGVLSRMTWRRQESLDDLQEERNLDIEGDRGFSTGRATPDEPGEGAPVQELALSGGQVASLQSIVTSVASGALPPKAGEQILLVAFPAISPEQAALMVGSAAAGAKATAPEAQPARPEEIKPNSPPPGSTPGGPGGKDWRGNGDPKKAPTETF